MQQRARSAPYGWIGFFVLLAVVAFIGLSRHHGGAPPASSAPLYGAGGSAQDRAESAEIEAGLRAMKSPVDVAPLVRAIIVRGDVLTVTVDGPSFAALSDDDRQRVFDDTASVWSHAYRAQHAASSGTGLTMDFVDGANELVHHRLIDVP